MAITWADISTITLFFTLAALLLGKGFGYLVRRDADEVRRNRQDACSPHRWVRDEHTGLVCGLCGKIPG